MQTARRLYVYLMSGVGLAVLVYGLRVLVTALLERAGFGLDAPIPDGDEALRLGLTLAFAAITVSLPVWLIHWFLAERSVRPGRPEADLERSSDVRGLYFMLVLGGVLLLASLAAMSLIETAILGGAGGDISFRSPAADVASIMVAGLAWGYHLLVRTRDWRAGPIEGAAAFLPRGYLYVAAFFGLIGLAGGINGLIELLGRFVLEPAPEFPGDAFGPWWAYPLGAAVASMIVGGAVWLGHSLYAERQRADPGWRGASERPAKVRLAYFVAVIVASAATVVYFLAEAGRGVLEALLGVSAASAAAEQVGIALIAVVSAITFGVVWFLHHRRMRAEAATFDERERLQTAERLVLHAPALVGLAAVAAGIASLIGVGIEATFGSGGPGSDDAWRRELAQALPLTVIGAVLWLWSWRAIGARYAGDPVAEGSSTTRRTYLLIVLAGSVLSGISALGTILYRLFGSLFGLDAPADPILELSLPIGVVVTAVAVALYHGQELRRDQARRSPDEVLAVPLSPAAIVIRVVAPPGTDREAALAAVRDGLPNGYVAEHEPADAP